MEYLFLKQSWSMGSRTNETRGLCLVVGCLFNLISLQLQWNFRLFSLEDDPDKKKQVLKIPIGHIFQLRLSWSWDVQKVFPHLGPPMSITGQMLQFFPQCCVIKTPLNQFFCLFLSWNLQDGACKSNIYLAVGTRWFLRSLSVQDILRFCFRKHYGLPYTIIRLQTSQYYNSLSFPKKFIPFSQMALCISLLFLYWLTSVLSLFLYFQS